jgi:peptidyl-prolyl cis-trans isomerase D
VFSLQPGATTNPLQTPLGWHILRVNKIEPAREPALDEVRDKLKTEIAQRLADEAMYQVSIRLEDELAAGAKLDEAAAKLGVPAIRVAAVDNTGRTPNGEREPALANDAEVLGTAFSTPQGQDSPVVEARGGGYYVLRVDDVSPAAKKPLDQIRPDVIRLWQSNKRDQAAKARAEEILAKVQGGAALSAAAELFGLKTGETPAVVRNADASAAGGHPPEVVVKLFELAAGANAVVQTRSGYYVVQLKEVTPAAPDKDVEGIAKLRTELRQGMGGDLVSQYGAALKRHFGVEINRRALDALL